MVLALPRLSGANDDLAGNWALTILTPTGTTETTNFVFKLETKEGKTTRCVVASNPTMIKPEVTASTRRHDHVRFTVKYSVKTAGKDKNGQPQTASLASASTAT